MPRAHTPQLCSFHNGQGQGGDFNFGIGNMGEQLGGFSVELKLRSIYGQRFRDERFCYKSVDSEFSVSEVDFRHSKRGVLSMANVGRTRAASLERWRVEQETQQQLLFLHNICEVLRHRFMVVLPSP